MFKKYIISVPYMGTAFIYYTDGDTSMDTLSIWKANIHILEKNQANFLVTCLEDERELFIRCSQVYKYIYRQEEIIQLIQGMRLKAGYTKPDNSFCKNESELTNKETEYAYDNYIKSYMDDIIRNKETCSSVEILSDFMCDEFERLFIEDQTSNQSTDNSRGQLVSIFRMRIDFGQLALMFVEQYPDVIELRKTYSVTVYASFSYVIDVEAGSKEEAIEQAEYEINDSNYDEFVFEELTNSNEWEAEVMEDE